VEISISILSLPPAGICFGEETTVIEAHPPETLYISRGAVPLFSIVTLRDRLIPSGTAPNINSFSGKKAEGVCPLCAKET
jgi:hypothetical protein